MKQTDQFTTTMILSKRKLRKRIAESAIPQMMHKYYFCTITTLHRRLMWESELLKAEHKYRLHRHSEAPADTVTHNEDHAI